MIYIVMDPSHQACIGDTPKEAWNNYQNRVNDYPIKECKFYVAQEIAVETQLVKVATVTTKSVNKEKQHANQTSK